MTDGTGQAHWVHVAGEQQAAFWYAEIKALRLKAVAKEESVLALDPYRHARKKNVETNTGKNANPKQSLGAKNSVFGKSKGQRSASALVSALLSNTGGAGGR